MRQWLRATRDRRCGSCDARIARGSPLLEVTMHQIHRALIRCASCADVPVPDDLPPLVDPVPIAEPVAVSVAPREWMPFSEGDDA